MALGLEKGGILEEECMIQRVLRYVMLGAAVVVLTACGGGSDPKEGKISDSTSSLSKDVQTIEPSNVVQTLQEDSEAQVLILDNSTKDLQKDKILYIPAGEDSRFPLGFAGKISSTEPLQDGKVKVVLEDAVFSEVIDTLHTPVKEVALKEENFIGVITPSAVTGLNSGVSKGTKSSRFQMGKSFLNGGVVFHKGQPVSTNLASSFLGDKNSVTQDDISLELNINLIDDVLEPSKVKPYGGKKELSAVLTGKLSNLVIKESHDIDLINMDFDPYVQMNFEVKGDLEAELKIQGGASVSLSSFNRAWKEVRKKTFEKFGIKGSYTGLSDEDKTGKFPVVGLVFVNPTPVTMKATQTAVRTAKTGGFIIWIYMNAKGELSVDGAVGVATNTRFNMGFDKPKDGKFKLIKDVSNIPSHRILEAPFIEGEVKVGATLGVSLEVDSFVAGVRLANAGIDMLGSYTQSFKVEGAKGQRASYGIDTLGSSWSWNQVRLCTEGQGQAGLLAHIDSALHLEAKREGSFDWTTIDYDKQLIDVHKQYPSQESIDPSKPGWVDYMWYVFDSTKYCFNNHTPVAEAITLNVEKNSQDNNLTLKGSDADSDPITYRITKQPLHGTLDGNAPTLQYTPEQDYEGSDSVHYVVNDGFEDSQEQVVSIRVLAPTTDTTPPTITIKGDNPATITQGGTYTDAGASATDDVDGTVSVTTVSSDVDTSTVGTYHVVYSAKDSAGNEANATREVKVVAGDTTPPIITIQGDNPATVTQGGTYTDAGASATDDVDGTVSVTTVSSDVDTATVGTYHVVYNAKDSAGNEANATREVKVVAASNSAPTAVAKAAPATVTQGEAVTFDASESNDSDGQIVSYAWKEGNTLLSTEVSFTEDNQETTPLLSLSLMMTMLQTVPVLW